jgi:hypothetical protein
MPPTLPLTTPDWLTKRGGSLQAGLGPGTVFVLFAGGPQYRLEVRPAAGRFTGAITQTVNGRRLDDGTTYPTAEAALAGGLDQLRNALGWS